MTEIYYPTKPKVIPVAKVPVYRPATTDPAAVKPAETPKTPEEESEF